MKQLLSFVFLLLSFAAFGQTVQPKALRVYRLNDQVILRDSAATGPVSSFPASTVTVGPHRGNVRVSIGPADLYFPVAKFLDQNGAVYGANLTAAINAWAALTVPANLSVTGGSITGATSISVSSPATFDAGVTSNTVGSTTASATAATIPTNVNSLVRYHWIGQSGSVSSNSTANSLLLSSNAYVNTAFANVYKSTGFASYLHQDAGAFTFYTAPSGTAGGAITFTERFKINNTGAIVTTGNITTTQYRLSALNTAPASATDTGTLGEIRFTAGGLFVCIATNQWVRATFSTF